MSPISFYTINRLIYISFFFFFNDTATTEIYTLSLHDALPIYPFPGRSVLLLAVQGPQTQPCRVSRSEEHTSELQSQSNLVCRLLLEKKKTFSPTVIYCKSTPDCKIMPNLRQIATRSVYSISLL